MSKRYFHYQSLEELEQEIRQLNLQIPLETNIDRLKAYLGRPVKIGPFTAGNSMAIHPMEGCDGTLDGRPDELTFRRYRRFGAGGAKLIWGEATAVVEEGRANPRQLLINDQTASDLERMLHECRQAHRAAFGSAEDLVIGLQLTHSGRYSYRRPLLAARAMVLPLVTTGDPDNIEHDWHTIFSSLGVLQYDTTIAGIVRYLGWCGMLGIVAGSGITLAIGRVLSSDMSPSPEALGVAVSTSFGIGTIFGFLPAYVREEGLVNGSRYYLLRLVPLNPTLYLIAVGLAAVRYTRRKIRRR